MFRNLLLTSTAFAVCGLFAAERVPSSIPGATCRLRASAVERPRDIRITPEVGVAGAQRLVREAVKAGRDGEIDVVFTPGEYRFEKPLVLDEKLDFPKTGRMVWRAEKPGMTVFSGAGAESFPIEMPAAGDPNLALVPEKARPFVRCLKIPGEGMLPGRTGVGCGGRPKIEEYGPELFVAGRRLVPARGPEKGDWLYTGECFGEKRRQEIAFGHYREVIAGGKDNEVSGNVVMNTPCPFSLGSRGPGSFAKQDVAMGTNSILWRAYLNWKRGGGTEKFLAKFPEIRKIEELAPLENLEKVQFALHALWNTVTNNAYVTAGAEDLQHWKDVGPYTVHAANERFEEDPGFVDYAGFNWELREDSPLRKKIGPTRFQGEGCLVDVFPGTCKDKA